MNGTPDTGLVPFVFHQPHTGMTIGVYHTEGFSCWWSCSGRNLEEITDLVLNPVRASYVQSIFKSLLFSSLVLSLIMFYKYSK